MPGMSFINSAGITLRGAVEILSIAILISIAYAPAFGQTFDARNQLAQSGNQIAYVPDAPARFSIAGKNGESWIRSGEALVSARLEGHPGSAGVVDQYGQIHASGNSMLVLSTGMSSGSLARPGTDVRFLDESRVDAQLRLRFDPPPGARSLSFRYQFLTAEFPDFVASDFSDEFSVTVIDELGKRRLLIASSVDSDLFPIASSFAKGSPMDIYARAPTQIQGNFDLGSPAAGSTGWRRVAIDVAQTGPVEIILSMTDGGDGLVDSTVLVENFDLQAQRFELPDRRMEAGKGGGVPEALDCIFQGGIVQGAVADGVTRVNFRIFRLSGPGTVVYSFAGSNLAPQDGGFDIPGGDQRLETVSVVTTLGEDGWEGVAQYTVPDEFNRGGDEQLGNRFVDLRADFFPDNEADPPASVTVPFNLFRPALILMHGLWSNATTWNSSPLVSDPNLITRVGDYRPTHASRFSRNTTRPAAPIREACQTLRANGIAATQFDYVGHSMGGIIGRNFDALVPGLINKFVTMNTPHTGSPLANTVVLLRDNVISQLFFGQAFLDYLRRNELAIDEGAMDDLAIGSTAINSIATTNLPGHALVGIGGSNLVGDALARVPGKIGVLFKILNFLDDNTSLFEGIQHDFVVGRRSQEGGIATSAISVFDGLDSIHTSATGSSAYAARIMELLNSDATGTSFGVFPAPSSLDMKSTNLPAHLPPLKLSVSDDIALNLPGGLTALAGDLVTVEVTGQNGFQPESALVITALEAVELTGPDLSGAIQLPEDFIGTLEFNVLAVDANQTVTSLTVPVEVIVTTNSELTGLSIVNDDMLLFEADDFRQMYVLGSFADGQTREITDPGTGTVYSSADPSIATIQADGLVTGFSAGITTLTAANSGFQSSISVEVARGQAVFADGFE